jgi:hypothetical protein
MESHINLNKSYKSIEIKFNWYRGGINKIDGINIGKNLEKGLSKTKKIEKTWKKINYT